MVNSSNGSGIQKSPIVTLDSSISDDHAVVANILTQVFSTIVIIIVFLFVRKKAPWIYFPNSERCQNHPCFKFTGFLNWISPVISIEDSKLLAMIGLDGFMLLQTIKLLLWIFLVLAIFCCPVLLFTFYRTHTSLEENRSGFFEKLIITSKNDETAYFLISIYAYLISIFIFYLIFIYYKKYVTLRQIYLVSPASLTSIETLRSISDNLSSEEDAIEFINSISKTVLLKRIPASISSDEMVRNYVTKLGLGTVKDAVLIQDTYKLRRLYDQRNIIIQDIEKEIQGAFLKIQSFYENNRDRCYNSFKEAYGSTLENGSLSIFKNMTFILKERVTLLNLFIKSSYKYLNMANPNISYLDIYLNQLRECNQAILLEKETLQNLEHNHTLVDVKPIDVPIDDEDVSFLGWKQLKNSKARKKLFSLELPYNSKKAFVTFEDYKTAGSIRDAQLGSKIFAPVAGYAPAPNDIIWKNVTKGAISSYVGAVFSTLFFLFYNIMFYIIILYITGLGKADAVEESNFVKAFFGSQQYSDLLKGVINPMIFNVGLSLSGIIIQFIISLEGIESYSLSQIRMMKLYAIFQFYNAFVSVSFSAPIFNIFSGMFSKNSTIGDVFLDLSTQFFKNSVFFLNLCVQRALSGTFTIFLKPVPFLVNFFLNPFLSLTQRQSDETKTSVPFDFGNVVPGILLVFSITIGYSCICPLIIIVGLFYFFFSYFVYKNDLLYACKNPYESGGIFWSETTEFIILSVCFFQLATFISVIVKFQANYIVFVIMPLLVIDFYFYKGLKELFRRNCLSRPINESEENFLDKFTKKVIAHRKEFLKEWNITTQPFEEKDEDTMPISEIGIKDKSVGGDHSYYKDPSMFMSSSKLKLPKHFYVCLYYLRTFDRNNVIGFNIGDDNEEDGDLTDNSFVETQA